MKIKRNANINIYKILSILLICIFIFFVPLFIQKLIKINKIECFTQNTECPDYFVKNTSYLIGVDYKTAKTELNQILKNNSQVDSYLIQYKIPNIIKIDLDLKEIKYVIKDMSGVSFLVNVDGLLVESSSTETNLPILINNRNNLKIGDTISKDELFAFKIIEKVKVIEPIDSANINDNYLEVKTGQGILVQFPFEGDVDVLVGSLKLIFSRLNEQAEGIRISDIKEIDLRFKNPILR